MDAPFVVSSVRRDGYHFQLLNDEGDIRQVRKVFRNGSNFFFAFKHQSNTILLLLLGAEVRDGSTRRNGVFLQPPNPEAI